MNITLVEKELNKIKGKDETTSYFWRPPEGESRIRIVPYKFNPEFPFMRIPFYYLKQPDGQTKTYISPSFFGNKDPILEFCEEIRKNNKSKEAWIMSKRMEPKIRVFAPVIVRGQEDRGTKFWAFSPKVYESILEKIKNPDYGDITDIQQGHDLIVIFEKKPSGKKYPETKVDIRLKPTPLLDNANQDLLNKILNDQVDLITLFKEPSYEELSDAFKASLEVSEASDENETGVESSSPQANDQSVGVYVESENVEESSPNIQTDTTLNNIVSLGESAKSPVEQNTAQVQNEMVPKQQPSQNLEGLQKLSMTNEEIMARLRATLIKK